MDQLASQADRLQVRQQATERIIEPLIHRAIEQHSVAGMIHRLYTSGLIDTRDGLIWEYIVEELAGDLTTAIARLKQQGFSKDEVDAMLHMRTTDLKAHLIKS